MNQSDQFREQIDACRRGSSDLSLPALSELAAAVGRDAAVAHELACAQQFDCALSAALGDLPAPTGLLDRLLASCGRSAPDSEPSLPPPANAVVLPAPRVRGWISRRWLLAGGSAALGLVLCVTLYQSSHPQRIVTESDLRDAAQDWLTTTQPPWRPLSGGAYPHGFPPDVAVKAKPQQWRSLSFDSANGWSATVAVVDLAPPGRPAAILFVVQTSARFSVPPLPTVTHRLGLSGGLRAIAWQRESSRILYLLAVEESRGQSLSDYLQQQPVARHLPRTGGRSS